MFLEPWMIITLVVATGVWAEYRYRNGVTSGVETTLSILQQRRMIKIDDQGQLVKHPHA